MLFIITNFQIWVFKKNVCRFISMVLLYGYKCSIWVYGGMSALFISMVLLIVISFQKWVYRGMNVPVLRET